MLVKETETYKILDFFADLCIVSADFSEMKESIGPQTNWKTGERYYECRFDIVLLFGLTELKAQVAWMENVGCTFLSTWSMSNTRNRE